MTTMTNERRPYFAYLLRLWQVRTDGDVVWHASIEDPHTGERHGFASLDHLFVFLEEQARGTTRCAKRPGQDGTASSAG
jgi:hypothetical protein